MADSVGLRIVFNLFKGLLLLIALGLFGFAYSLNKNNLAMDKWQPVKAKVFYSDVVVKQAKTLGQLHSYYAMDIKYGYIVNKKLYNSTGLFLKKEPKDLTEDFYKLQQQEFKAGKIVTAYYNPNNPKQSYLLANLDDGIRAFYDVTKTILYAILALFLLTPFYRLFNEKRYIKNNTFEQGLIIPDNAKRISHKDRYTR